MEDVSTLEPDREARFRALYADAYVDVLRFAQRRVHPSHAEDVTADAFLVVWRRLDDAPERPDDVRAWLFGIARHCLLNTRRGVGRHEALAVRSPRRRHPSAWRSDSTPISSYSGSTWPLHGGV